MVYYAVKTSFERRCERPWWSMRRETVRSLTVLFLAALLAALLASCSGAPGDAPETPAGETEVQVTRVITEEVEEEGEQIEVTRIVTELPGTAQTPALTTP